VIVGGGAGLAGKVEVMMKGVVVTKEGDDRLKPQPVVSKAAIRLRNKSLATWQL
jgi:hypothetical protein